VKEVGDRTLTIVALLIALIIAAIAWFLAIGPKLSSAQAAREETATQEDMNDLLELTLAQRQGEAQDLPDMERQLFWIRDILPPTEDCPSVRRLIDDAIAGKGVDVTVDSLQPPFIVPGGLSLAAPMERVGLTSAIEGMVFTTLEATRISVELSGDPYKIMDALYEMQFSEHRYFLVEGLSLDVVSDIELQAVVSGVFFTLDRGTEGITVRPDERPWPGTAEDEPEVNTDNPFQTGSSTGGG